MTDNNSTSNPTLTFDQLQAIDVAQKTLANLQSEIVIATKILKGTKMESDRAVKEKLYQEELLENTKTQVEDETKQLNYLTSEIAQSNVILTKLNDEINTKTEIQRKKDVALQDRESAVQKREIEVAKVESSLKEKVSAHAETSQTFNSKVAKLKEVISTF
jgi:chromosome segregation ATPase